MLMDFEEHAFILTEIKVLLNLSPPPLLSHSLLIGNFYLFSSSSLYNAPFPCHLNPFVGLFSWTAMVGNPLLPSPPPPHLPKKQPN